MTVMLIIGLMSSAVILTLPEDKPELEVFSDMLLRDLNGASQESLLSGRPTALGLSEEAYAILTYKDGEWVSVKNGDWPDRSYAEFTKESLDFDLPEDLTPLVVFEPIGQSTVFTLSLEKDDQTVHLESKGDGRVFVGSGL